MNDNELIIVLINEIDCVNSRSNKIPEKIVEKSGQIISGKRMHCSLIKDIQYFFIIQDIKN